MSYMMSGAVELIAKLMMTALGVAFFCLGVGYLTHQLQTMGMIGILSIPIVMMGGFFGYLAYLGRDWKKEEEQ